MAKTIIADEIIRRLDRMDEKIDILAHTISMFSARLEMIEARMDSPETPAVHGDLRQPDPREHVPDVTSDSSLPTSPFLAEQPFGDVTTTIGGSSMPEPKTVTIVMTTVQADTLSYLIGRGWTVVRNELLIHDMDKHESYFEVDEIVNDAQQAAK